jgi:hypothetical protein
LCEEKSGNPADKAVDSDKWGQPTYLEMPKVSCLPCSRPSSPIRWNTHEYMYTWIHVYIQSWVIVFCDLPFISNWVEVNNTYKLKLTDWLFHSSSTYVYVGTKHSFCGSYISFKKASTLPICM